MLNVLNLKLFRKLMVLCVLMVGLFFTVSINKAKAEPCCWMCDITLNACLNSCGGPTTGERTCIESCYAEDEICRDDFCSHCP